jgi:hypothetical protein
MTEKYNARPWHLLNKDKYPRSDESIEEKRFCICEGCPSLISGVCKECGCFMKQKVKLELAYCPLGKW